MGDAIFRPQPRTNGRVVRHINYTCSPEKYEELETIAARYSVSLKELLRQMVEFSLKSMTPPPTGGENG